MELPVARKASVLSAEELGQKAGMLANRALEEGMRILDEGSETAKIRVITAIANHPLRRMQTDTSKQQEAMKSLLDQILMGGAVVEDDDAGDS